MLKVKNILLMVCVLMTAAFALNYNVPKASVTPSIDGVVNEAEWMDARYIPMAYPDIVTFPKEGSLRSGTSAPDNAMDYSINWYVKWDDNYLYLAGRVYDDIFTDTAGSDTPQLCFNMNNNPHAAYLSEALVWNIPANGPINTNTTESGAPAPNNSNIAGSILADGYMIEVRLAWTDIDPNDVYQPAVNDVHGFGLACQDHDAGGLRETFLLDFGSGVVAMSDLSTWNTITLTANQACGDWEYPAGDLNKDCVVDIEDFSFIAAEWLKCTDPGDSACIELLN